VFPAAWVKIMTFAAALGTTLLAIFEDISPFLWIPAAILAGCFALLFIHLWLALRDLWKRDEDRAAIERTPPQIKICFEKSSPYEASNIEGGRVISRVRIGVKNAGDMPLSNCQVYVDKISPMPPLTGGVPILLAEPKFTLRGDDPERLIDVASHWDHVDSYRFSSDVGWSAETANYINEREPRTIVLKVEATECQRSATFRLWTDDHRVLRMEYLGYST
jgi:hypothetical protein